MGRLGIRFFFRVIAIVFRLKMPAGHCIECDKAINRDANLIEYKGFTYHTNCFVCQICAKNITGPQGFINDPVDAKKHYCHDCYKQNVGPGCHCSKKKKEPEKKEPEGQINNNLPKMDSSAPLRFPDVIKNKRDGKTLEEEEIAFFIKGVVQEKVDYAQIGAMLMAIYYKGMTLEETACLTKAMMNSGDILKWPPEWKDILVDKHSTGGVGDKVSIILAPALAALGLKVPMMSGRGLGFTGGTLDKLESIPGFNVTMTQEAMLEALDKEGCVIIGQSSKLVPADRIIYSLRDITATVDSLPLITASILSKKGAESVSHLVMDIKVGKGALFKTLEEAEGLTKYLVKTGKLIGIGMSATLTDMNSPLGRCVGNALEIWDSLETMRGKGRSDLVQLISGQGALLLQSVGFVSSEAEGVAAIEKTLSNGEALKKFKQMAIAQGVDAKVAAKLCSQSGEHDWEILQKAKYQTDIPAPSNGYLRGINALEVAEICGALGSGRSRADDEIDFGVGLEVLQPYGTFFNKDEPILRLHHSCADLSPSIVRRLKDSVDISEKRLAAKDEQKILRVITPKTI